MPNGPEGYPSHPQIPEINNPDDLVHALSNPDELVRDLSEHPLAAEVGDPAHFDAETSTYSYETTPREAVPPAPVLDKSPVAEEAAQTRVKHQDLDGVWVRPAPELGTDQRIIAFRIAEEGEIRPKSNGDDLNDSNVTLELWERSAKEEERQRQQVREKAGQLDRHIGDLRKREIHYIDQAGQESCHNPLEHEILERDGDEKHPYLSRLNQLFYDDFIPLLEKEAGVDPSLAIGTIKAVLEAEGQAISEEDLANKYEAIRRTHPEVRRQYTEIILVPRLFERIKAGERDSYNNELNALTQAEIDAREAHERSLEEQAEVQRSQRGFRKVFSQFGPQPEMVEEYEEGPELTRHEKRLEELDARIRSEGEISDRAVERLSSRLQEVRERVLEGIYISQDESDVIQATAWYLGIKEHEGRHKNRTKERDPEDPTKVLESKEDDIVATDKYLSLVGRSDVDPESETDPVRVYQNNMLMKRTLGKLGVTDESIMWIGHFTQRPGGKPFPGAILAENRLGGHELAVGNNPGTIEIRATLRWVTERSMKVLLGELYSDPDAERVIAQEWNDPTIFMANTLNEATEKYIVPELQLRSDINQGVYAQIAELRRNLITDNDSAEVIMQKRQAIAAATANIPQLPSAETSDGIVDAEVVEHEPQHATNGHDGDHHQGW